MRVLLALACLLASCARTPAGAPPGPHVYLVIVDGLDARFADAKHMPRLFALLEREGEHSSFFPAAHAVMPARTNPNHVTLVTGAYADAHGITGNAYWSRVPGAPPEKLDDAALIEVETLFTVAETTTPSMVTLAVVGKPKLARLFAAVPGRQRAPDVLWSPERLPAERRDAVTGYSPDAETMAAALAAMAASEPDLALMNLSDVDRTGHARGPESDEYGHAITGADAAIARLVDDLRARGRWGRSVVIVTADHGMTGLDQTRERPRAVISLTAALGEAGIRGVVLVADGGVEHAYAAAIDPREPALARVAQLAAATPGVAEVLSRAAIAERHPGWRLDHPRTGELLLVAAPGFEFVDPFDPVDAALRGNHGGPQDLTVPLVVTGGWPGLRSAPRDMPAPVAVDVAPTIAALLGLRAPRLVDGRPVPPDSAGHPIAAVLAHSPH